MTPTAFSPVAPVGRDIDFEAGHVYIGVDPTNRLVEITA